MYRRSAARERERFSVVKQEVLGEVQATSTAVQVSALALPGLLVEVTVMAVRSGR